MNDKHRLLIVGLIDEILRNDFDKNDLLTKDEHVNCYDRLHEVIDTSSPRELRESLVELGRKLYEEVGDAE